ncbi:hypothetical protein DFA_00396 [Cavenderia fasciculata]|uniref:Endonuclease/exonuclease/phosphatase domain-containing protein n=1 Tax=Cavenderia fasciculata TaxID=261658 RepID=F4PRN6_CACFS|nr:uncharacterized protein DFA_00396 [Cavenderia fasciculata]EGG20535.1 hypothetical protein DFA_00396 [Cavenderia fasciculata]|eukprot:XP_004358385.1 hypothetical protein DFA_00396 [Cavenderia fasciculata]
MMNTSSSSSSSNSHYSSPPFIISPSLSPLSPSSSTLAGQQHSNNATTTTTTTTMGVEIMSSHHSSSSSSSTMIDTTGMMGCYNKQTIISSSTTVQSSSCDSSNVSFGLPPPPPPPPSMPSNNIISIHKRKLININNNRSSSSLTTPSSSSSSSSSSASPVTMDQLLSGFNRNNLARTKTKVRTADGRIYEEQVSLQICEFKGIDESSVTKKYTTITNLPPFIYCNNQCKWTEYKYHQQNNNNNNQQQQQQLNGNGHHHNVTNNNNSNNINILTINVWFDSFVWHERAQSLFEEISSLLPDVVCLQEVTPMFLDLLKEQIWVKNHYILSDSGQSDTVFPYGTIIMTKYQQHNNNRYKLVSFTLYPLPSNQNRRMIMSTLIDTLLNKTIIIGSVHLESLKQNGQDRVKQLDYISNTFKSLVNSHGPSSCTPLSSSSSSCIGDKISIPNSPPPSPLSPPSSPIKQQQPTIYSTSPLIPSMFLVGDFNFGESTFEDKELIEKGFTDLWKCPTLTNNNENNHNSPTIDNSTNGITCIKKNERVDRLVYWNNPQHHQQQQQQQQKVRVTLINMIGTKAIEIEEEKRRIEKIDRDEIIYPSDHFGLQCHINHCC